MPSTKRPFGELFSEPTRNGLTRPKAVRGSGTKMVNMGELFAYPRIRNAPMERVPLSDDEAEKSLLQDGDLLFARQSLVLEGAGKCSIFLGDDEPVTFESHVTRVRLDSQKADPQYYFYFFQSPQGRAAVRSIVEQGAGAAGIRGSDLKTLDVTWCDVDEQSEIGAILGTLDDKIELNRRMNETLESIARAIFKSWFVDFDPVRAKVSGEAPESICQSLGLTPDLLALFPDRLVDSELGEIPEGWEARELGSCLELLKDGSHNPPKRVPEGIRFIAGATDVKHFSVDFAKCTYITEEDYRTMHRKWMVQSGDVLLTIVGTVGNVALVAEHDLPFSLQRSVAVLRPGPTLSSSFLYCLLQTGQFQTNVRSRLNPTAQPGIYLGTLGAIPFCLPTRDVITAFDDLASVKFAKMQNMVLETRALTVLRDTLLPKLFSGELRVGEADSNIEACA